MASVALSELQTRLQDVDEVIAAHVALTGGGRGRPIARRGAALTRAGVVLLAAATEGFVEDLFKEAAALLWPTRPPAQMNAYLAATAGRFANANAEATEILLSSLGLPWALDTISWRRFTNSSFRSSLNRLIQSRNEIAHGQRPTLQLRQLRAWRNMVGQYGPQLEGCIAAHITVATGQAPPW